MACESSANGYQDFLSKNERILVMSREKQNQESLSKMMQRDVELLEVTKKPCPYTKGNIVYNHVVKVMQ